MSLTLADLQQKLSKADSAAVLVSRRVLERVMQEVYNLQGLFWTLPHMESFLVDRQILFRIVDPDELNIGSHQVLPATLSLITRPTTEELQEKDTRPLLLQYWRRLYHAVIHRVLEEKYAAGLITDELIGKRIDSLGRAEFEEIRSVLHQDNFIVSPQNQKEVYFEFVAIFLEMYAFAPRLIPIHFPALGRTEAVIHLLSKDVDGQELLRKTRLENCPDPDWTNLDNQYESHEYYWKLVRNAEKAVATGNEVKAAIFRTIAARVAPADLSPSTKADAEASLQRLTQRLQTPLGYDKQQSSALLQDLNKLLEKADQGRRPVEADLLYDLQKVCLDSEKEIYSLDFVDWLFSLGKRPIRQPLPTQRMVRVIRHIRAAAQKLNRVRLSEEDRKHLSRLLQFGIEQAEKNLRDRIRPVLVAVLHDVGLSPSTMAEHSAFDKMTDEFLDRVADIGFVTFSDLRDTISRNNLKMRDLQSPQEFLQGDALLRLDRRLATLLDGVYRPSEIYMRGLEQLTAINFGTQLGRVVTKYITLPIFAAFFTLETVFVVKDLLFAQETPEREIEETTFQDAASDLVARFTQPSVGISFFALIAFFLLLFHSAWMRKKCWRLLVAFGKKCRFVLVDVPLWFAKVPSVQQFFQSWTVQLSYYYVIKPLVITLALSLLWYSPRVFANAAEIPYVAITLLFFAVNILINSRTGLVVNELILQLIHHTAHLVRANLFGGIYKFIVFFFKQIGDFFEAVLFQVDEWLRFRKGDSEFSLFLRTVLSILWFPISFLVRFYFFVLIEPGINPIKFPISSVAAKILYPFLLPLIGPVTNAIAPYLGTIPSYALVSVTLILLPDAFGFLIWETKENWNLYRANRSKVVEPVLVGHHGETVRALLQPGFHSGTIPKLFARIRKAERESFENDSWRSVRSYRSALDEVNHDIRRFLSRDFVALLHLAPNWKDQPLSIDSIRLANNRIDFSIRHKNHAERSCDIQFEYRLGWMIARIPNQGWIRELPEQSMLEFQAALGLLYKMAAIEIVEEQIRQTLGKEVEHSIEIDGIAVDGLLYPIRSAGRKVRPKTRDGKTNADRPSYLTRELFFARVPIYWSQLQTVLQNDDLNALDSPLISTTHGLLGTLPTHRGNGTKELVSQGLN